AADEASPAYFNRLVTHGTPTVAGAVAVGLSSVYLTIKHHAEATAQGVGAAHGQNQAGPNEAEGAVVGTAVPQNPDLPQAAQGQEA
ncbi:MAG: hypothetical protein WAS33_02440, partial [Candidatus Promineifilaceae bacterium]